MLNFIYVLVVAIIATGINLSALFTASEPSMIQTAASSIFLVFWLLFSMYKGLNREQSFAKFALFYWGVGLVLSFAGAIPMLRAIAVATVFIFTGPSYGLFYYVTNGFVGMPYILLSIFTPLLLAIIGYFVGTMIGKVEVIQPEEK